MRKRLDGGFYTHALVLQSNTQLAGLVGIFTSTNFSKLSLDVDWIAQASLLMPKYTSQIH